MCNVEERIEVPRFLLENFPVCFSVLCVWVNLFSLMAFQWTFIIHAMSSHPLVLLTYLQWANQGLLLNNLITSHEELKWVSAQFHWTWHTTFIWVKIFWIFWSWMKVERHWENILSNLNHTVEQSVKSNFFHDKVQ